MIPVPDMQTEEVAEVRHLQHQLPADLPPVACRSRLARALPLLGEDPAEALRILTAPSTPTGLGEA
jgi:hypothetical protein